MQIYAYLLQESVTEPFCC